MEMAELTLVATELGVTEQMRSHIAHLATDDACHFMARPLARDCNHVPQAWMSDCVTDSAEYLDVRRIFSPGGIACIGASVMPVQVLGRSAALASTNFADAGSDGRLAAVTALGNATLPIRMCRSSRCCTFPGTGARTVIHLACAMLGTSERQITKLARSVQNCRRSPRFCNARALVGAAGRRASNMGVRSSKLFLANRTDNRGMTATIDAARLAFIAHRIHLPEMR